MIFSTQFGGGAALGSIAQGIGLAEPQYVRCDGRTLVRASYPRLSTLFPIGQLTGTVRALAAASLNSVVAASPNYFVAGANSVAAGGQYSSDGVTWSQASLVTPFIFFSVLFAGTRWLATGGAGSPVGVTAGDNPNSTWASTTGVTVSGVARNGIAYSPTLGRAAFINSSSSTNIATLDDGATVLINRTASSQTRSGICHTGSKFVTLNGATTSSSSDALTWADAPLPEVAAASGSIASNGAGVAVITGVASGLLVSSDHGATWAKTAIPGVPASATWLVTYSGDRFFVSMTLGVAMSLDGKAWFLEPQLVQARLDASMFAKKGSTFVQVQSIATAYSFAESATHFNAPLVQSFSPVASGSPTPLHPSFIKAL